MFRTSLSFKKVSKLRKRVKKYPIEKMALVLQVKLEI